MKDSAMEAELRAARERAVIPLETRNAHFREMLSEKEVKQLKKLYSISYFILQFYDLYNILNCHTISYD
jgi:hypothetical protein